MLPTIPTINLVIKSESFTKEFESYIDMMDYLMFEDVRFYSVARQNFHYNGVVPKNYFDSLNEYAHENYESFIDECGYTLQRIVKG